MLIVEKKFQILHVRKKTIFKTKITKKCSKTTKIWHLETLTLLLHNKNIFANTTKRFGDSTIYIYWDMDQKTQILNFFWGGGQNFKIYGLSRI